MNIWSYHV